MFRIALLAAAFTVASVAAAAPTGDVGRGEIVAKKQCAMCHSVKPGERRVGPSLFGVVGRTAGSEAGFTYSPATLKAKLTFDAKTLDAFLKSPGEVIPGTTMSFSGMTSADERADLIAYLRSLK